LVTTSPSRSAAFDCDTDIVVVVVVAVVVRLFVDLDDVGKRN
jgi:hypothetical protein